MHGSVAISYLQFEQIEGCYSDTLLLSVRGRVHPFTAVQTLTHTTQQQIQLLKGRGGHLQTEGEPPSQKDVLVLAKSKALQRKGAAYRSATTLYPVSV